MKRIGLVLAMILVGPSVLSMAGAAPLVDVVPIQGHLIDDTGTPVADGSYSLVFSVWDLPVGGTQKWSETQTVTTLNGNFTAYLGSVNPIDEDVFYINIGVGELPYLQIKVESDPPLTPRMLLGGSPLAFVAARMRGNLLRTESDEVHIGKEGQDALVVIAQPAPERVEVSLTAGATATLPAVQLMADATSGRVRLSDGSNPLSRFELAMDKAAPKLQMVDENGTSWIDVLANPSGGQMRIGDLAGDYSVINSDPTGSGMTFYSEVTGLDEPIIDILSNANGGKITLFGPTAGGMNSTGGRSVFGDATTAVSDPAALNAYMELKSDANGGQVRLIGDSPFQPVVDIGALPGGGHVRLIGGSALEPTVELTADAGSGRVSLNGQSPIKPFVEMAVDDLLAKLSMGANGEDYFTTAADSDSVCLSFILPGPPGPPSWGLCANFNQGTMNMVVPELSIIPPGPISPEIVLYDQSAMPIVTIGEDAVAIWDVTDLSRSEMTTGGINVYNSAGVLSAVFEPNGVSAPTADFGSSNSLIGTNTFVAGNQNTVNGNFSSVGGGTGNIASGGSATVAGGIGNDALFGGAFVGGGNGNTASGVNSTVPGGTSNSATGAHSFAAGRSANANHDGAFAWSDASGFGVTTDINNQFKIRATGGTIILSDTTPTAGVRLSKGSSVWQTLSDRNAKRNIRQVDADQILALVQKLNVHRWSYKTQSPDIEHMGPMAQDFYALFGLGEDERHLTSLDLAGVALASIQALNESLTELEVRTAELEIARADMASQSKMMTSLASRLERLEGQLTNEALRLVRADAATR